MKYLGLDLGSVTCGVAISDALGMLARNLETLRFKEDDYEYALQGVDAICKREGVKDIVLGMPKHMNGDLGIRANLSIEFKEKLEKLGYKVYLVDERLSTVSAQNYMKDQNVSGKKNRALKDEMAACIILQQFLDGGKR